MVGFQQLLYVRLPEETGQRTVIAIEKFSGYNPLQLGFKTGSRARAILQFVHKWSLSSITCGCHPEMMVLTWRKQSIDNYNSVVVSISVFFGNESNSSINLFIYICIHVYHCISLRLSILLYNIHMILMFAFMLLVQNYTSDVDRLQLIRFTPVSIT